MSRSFAEKIADLEVERTELEHELEYSPAERQRMLKARLASLARSLRWYSMRLPRDDGEAGAPQTTDRQEE